MLQVQNVSDRVKVGHKLEEAERRSRSILDISSDAILVMDQQGDILWVNKSTLSIFGYAGDELIQRNVDVLLPSHASQEEVLGAKCIFDSGASMSRTAPMDSSALTKEGRLFPVEVSVKEVDFDNNRRFIAFVRDISERRALEHEVLRVSEMERQNIGQDIHDLLASKFSGIALMGRGLINQLPSSSVDVKSLEYIVELARSGATSARALARGLNPVALEQFGLKSALSELKHEVLIMSSLACSLDVPDDLPHLEPVYAAQLYRIAHEAVTNVMKHAEATQLSIRVVHKDHDLIMHISDNGKGLTRGVDDVQGMGLHIMNYRARMLHGLIRIQSSPGNRTSVVCKIPLPPS